jgi:hypothetical protein
MRYLVIAFILAACSSSHPAGSAAAPARAGCTTPHGSYMMHFTEHSGGTCGPITDELTVINDATAADALSKCQVVGAEQGSGCSVDAVANCNIQGHAMNMTMSLDWAADGESCKGIATVSVINKCLSTYDLTYTRPNAVVACRSDGTGCEDANDACCKGNVCVKPDATSGASCRKLCYTNKGCPSDCCIQPADGTHILYCAPSYVCTASHT